jgi:hypothetical protein
VASRLPSCASLMLSSDVGVDGTRLYPLCSGAEWRQDVIPNAGLLSEPVAHPWTPDCLRTCDKEEGMSDSS